MPEDLLTIADAVLALTVSRSRVHQLLTEGELDGPELPPGRQRHRPGAGRVTRSSLTRYLTNTARGHEHGDTTVHASNAFQADEEPTESTMRNQDAERGARTENPATSVELKAALDLAREALSAERERSRRLAKIARSLLDEVLSGIEGADKLDVVTSALSDALTQELVADFPPSTPDRSTR